MDAFSFLKYWKGGGGGGSGGELPPPSTTAIFTAIPRNDTETEDDNSNSGDEGPFFDLEFTVPDEESLHSPPNPNHTQNDVVKDYNNKNEEEEECESESCECECECECESELKFTLSPSKQSDDPNNLSPSQDILVHLELKSSEPNSKPHSTANANTATSSSLLKSATKLRVFMSGLKKTTTTTTTTKSNVAKDKDLNEVPAVASQRTKKQSHTQNQRKNFTVKFKVEEVPIMSLFTRDNSSRGQNNKKLNSNSNNNTEEESQTQTQTQAQAHSHSSAGAAASDEKRLHKYLKMVKPLYVRVSRRYVEKLRFSGQINMTAGQKPAPAESVAVSEKEKEKEKEKVEKEEDGLEGNGGNMKSGQKQRNLDLTAGLRVVCKHLGKSRSAAETAAPESTAPAAAGMVSSRRRDDSLLQQQDGIQGAILHCKRSFNASRECESSELPQGVSNTSQVISPELSRKSTNEGKNKK